MKHCQIKRRGEACLALEISTLAIILCITTAADGAFEDVGLGARPLAMGSAFTATADDASAIFWNSAGLARVDRRELTTSYMELYDLVSYSSIGYAQPTEAGPIGMGIISSSDVDGVYREITFALSVARKVYSDLSVGANVKYLSSAANTGDIRIGRGRGLALDLGCQYRMMADLLSFGIAFQNLVGYVSYDRETVMDIPGEKYWEEPALSYKIGAGIDLGRLLSQVSQMENALLTAEVSDGDIHIGTEYVFWNILAIRAGFRTGNALSRAITMGLGLRLSSFTLDHAYISSGVGSQTSQFSVSINW